MKLKTDWLNHLHTTRRREIEIVFDRVPNKTFMSMLEIGAGDGFQSRLLARFAKHLTCTDFDAAKSKSWHETEKNVTYQVCDAEDLPSHFKKQSFDCVFSSNLFEHLHNPGKVFRDTHDLLTQDGIMVHIMPGPLLKLTWLILFYPNQAVTLLEKITDREGIKNIFKAARGSSEGVSAFRPDLGNNPKVKPRHWVVSQFWPEPHGAYKGHLQEFFAYHPRRWRREIEAAGFEIIGVKKMPVASGYGFGFDVLRKLLEKLRFSSSYAYVAQKQGADSKFRQYFK